MSLKDNLTVAVFCNSHWQNIIGGIAPESGDFARA
jgi:hypothetical protein